MARLVLVHGSVTNGAMTWGAQRPLAERWELVVLERPGFPPGPAVERVDFETDASRLSELLEPGDHLCGHSYGGVVALLAAARSPALGSLTVIEPPATRAAAGVAAADEFGAGAERMWREGPDDPETFLRGFLRAVGSDRDPPTPLPPQLAQGAEALRRERGPWEAEIPVDALRDRPFRKLVVSGDTTPPSTRSATRSSGTSTPSVSCSPAMRSSGRRASTRYSWTSSSARSARPSDARRARRAGGRAGSGAGSST